MNRLLRFFLDLCLLRAAPQDAPASQALMGVVLLAYLLLGVASVIQVLGRIGPALGAALIDELALVALPWALLRLRGRSARFLQTVTALLGSGALLTALALPLQALSSQELPSRELTDALTLLIWIWIMVVMGHILRHAMEVPMAVGVLLGIGYVLVSSALFAILFTVPV